VSTSVGIIASRACMYVCELDHGVAVLLLLLLTHAWFANARRLTQIDPLGRVSPGPSECACHVELHPCACVRACLRARAHGLGRAVVSSAAGMPPRRELRPESGGSRLGAPMVCCRALARRRAAPSDKWWVLLLMRTYWSGFSSCVW
jgi:hypothetical protein